MSAEKHSELPWKADKYIHEPKNLCIVNSKDEVIAIIPSGVPSAVTLPDKENADYIVRATNAFPALVEALEKVQAYHQYVMKEHVWHLEANAQVGCIRMLKELEAALKSAKGE